MAIRALMLKKKIDRANANLTPLLDKKSEFETRESELQKALEEAETDEEINAVEEEVTQLESERKENEEAITALEEEIKGYKDELAELEAAQEEETPTPAPADQPVPEDTRKAGKYSIMEKRNIFSNLSYEERNAMFEREDVKTFLNAYRDAVKEKRAIQNIGLTIPEDFLGFLRENIMDYSKLLKHTRFRRVGGQARIAIMSGLQEAIWTECCANLNEMSMTFYDASVDCFRIGGYYSVCNADIEDSDINLASEILTAIATGIGYALDKAILYGRNTSANYKMPLGVVSRLAQTAQPSDYSPTARPWADLHNTNIVTITTANSTGIKLFQEVLKATKAIKNNFSRGEKVWVMNESTYTTLLAESMSVNAGGVIVAGVNGIMPVVGGVIEVLDFVPDNVIIVGYFDLYLLAERAGQKFATSEHVRFLQDGTVFRGTARYDGAPLIAEGFMAIGINSTTPNATMTFASDLANQGE